MGNGQKGVYPRICQPDGGIGKTRPREALPRAPTRFKFNSDALARCPQPMPSTHTLFSFFGHVIGANGTVALGGQKDRHF